MDENITNTRNKLSSVVDELFLKTELEAQAGAKIAFLVGTEWSGFKTR